MTRLALLNATELAEYENPPCLTDKQRLLFFVLSDEVKKTINRLQSKINKIGFFIQLAYFKACQQFFEPDIFHQKDLSYVANVLGYMDCKLSEIKSYGDSKTIRKHRQSILNLLGFKAFDEKAKDWLCEEARNYAQRQVAPKKIFLALLKVLQQQQIAFPKYHALAKLISDAYLSQEAQLLGVIKKELPTEIYSSLDALLLPNKKSKLTPLRAFKIIHQSSKPKGIQASVNIFNQIKPYFKQAQNTLETLDLHDDCTRYYATWVRKAKLSQLQQIPNKANLYLHLINFIKHQVYMRHDYFIDTFLKSVQTARNSVAYRLSRSENSSRKERRLAAKKISSLNYQKEELIRRISQITSLSVITDSEKIESIENLLGDYHRNISEKEKAHIKRCEELLEKFGNNQELYQCLEAVSIRLQNRVAGIIKVFMFNEFTSEPVIYNAVKAFVKYDGKCSKDSPTDFLSPEETQKLFDDKKKFRPSLYKVLLFIHVADAIKSGKLNLKHSYRFKAIQDYMISDKRWSKKRIKLIEKAGLSEFVDVNKVMNENKTKLDNLYNQTNKRFQDGLNPYLTVNEENKLIIKTPAQAEKETGYVGDLLSQKGLVPILQVLTDINNVTKLTCCFEHHNNKNVKKQPSDETFFAGIIGLGCNIGIPTMGQVSMGVNANTLTNTVNWYFSLRNLKKANASIVQLIHELALSDIFVDEINHTHSSSDGRKVNVKVDSLIASLSFKYFGKDKGVSVYTFIDDRQALFHSLVMSASEREAAYVFDGLLDNEVDKSIIHSTDTHGYREGIFAAAPFMDVSYAPRIKNISKQKIYSFSCKSTYEKKGFKILPSAIINQKLIKDNWDDVLRFMTTIKLKEATASQLFKRLSSYAKHHPLYKALKEFGRIIKSQFILKYFDDVILRQKIEKQLNRVELSNKFANAVFFANNGEFQQSESEEQALATACKVLIQNAVVLWNYLYLSQLLINCADKKEQNEMLTLISQGSVITWQHINWHGEYDFRRFATNDCSFNMAEILTLSLQR